MYSLNIEHKYFLSILFATKDVVILVLHLINHFKHEIKNWISTSKSQIEHSKGLNRHMQHLFLRLLFKL